MYLRVPHPYGLLFYASRISNIISIIADMNEVSVPGDKKHVDLGTEELQQKSIKSSATNGNKSERLLRVLMLN